MRTCEFEGCDRKHKAKGLCINHYQQHKDRGVLVPLRSTTQRICEFEGCGRGHMAKGLCNGHYLQKVGGKELTPLRSVTTKTRLCMVEDCGRKHMAKGLCHRHYDQEHRSRDPKKCWREECDICEDVAWLRAAGEVEENIARRIGLRVSTVQAHTRVGQ
jgi:hypothetical protein